MLSARLILLLVLPLFGAAIAAAQPSPAAPVAPATQQRASIHGQVAREDGTPLIAATVLLDELRLEATTASDGSYRFDQVPVGRYHVSVRAEGYSTRRTEVVVGAQGARVDLVVALDLHFAEVVSVSPTARSQFESYQPTSVLAGQDLQKQLEASLGATLQSEPGVAMRSLGPGPARPVIRGLDGDRVAVLQDGQRVGDLSSQSGDHGVTLNPSSANRIEVVRGPATLLYGANAIGGLVNVITDQIPTAPVTAMSGEATLDLGSNAGEAGGAGDVHFGNGRVAVHVAGGSRRSGDYSTPDGEVDNSQSRTNLANIGASWTGTRRYVGASYGIDDSEYGVPIIEEGQIRLTPRRHALTIRAGGEELGGLVRSFRGTFGLRRYEHQELVGSEVGTRFNNDTEEAELLASHRPFGKLSGTVGASLYNRDFAATGEEALSPPVGQRAAALFVYEELAWSHITVQFGGRLDHTAFSPDSSALPERSFNEFSGSLGLLLTPRAANDSLVFAVSLARAARNPALEELYFFGPHPGNFAFEIGNPDLGSEHALGVDVSVRARTDRIRGEVTLFHNSISDFIFRRPLDGVEFASRAAELAARFGTEEDGEAPEEDLQIIEFSGADSRLFGLEAHADINLTRTLVFEVTYDWVRGELSDSGDPLPRLPPQRVIPGLRYQRDALQVGGTVSFIGEQNRVYATETPTEGSVLGKLYASYSFVTGAATSTVTARLDNAGNTVYRNHLNYLKDVLPEIGRTLKVVYSLSF